METIYTLAKRLTADYFNIPVEMLEEKTRKQEVVLCRYICYKMVYVNHKKITKIKTSLAKIGKYIGGKDHATVLHGIKTMDNYLYTNKVKSLIYYQIERKFLMIAMSGFLDITDHAIYIAIEKIRKAQKKAFWKRNFEQIVNEIS